MKNLVLARGKEIAHNMADGWFTHTHTQKKAGISKNTKEGEINSMFLRKAFKQTKATESKIKSIKY